MRHTGEVMLCPLALSRRRFAVLSAGAAAAAMTGATAAGGVGALAVVELFTSQGCASCPPADLLLEELSRLPGVIALSLNVDYWDYLGWRDTLGSPDCAQRQREYARRRGDGLVYTPQSVINGELQVVGSDRAAILPAIAWVQSRDPRKIVPVRIAGGDRKLLIEIGSTTVDHPGREATVWLMMIAPRTVVEIERGENAGRTVAYTNVVHKIIPVGMWQGERVSVSLPKSVILTKRTTACAVLVQVDGAGPILGAAWLSSSRL